VVYGKTASGNLNPGEGAYTRIKCNRFGLFTILPGGPPVGYYQWRADNVEMYFKADDALGTRTFEVKRSTGNLTTGGNMEPYIDGTGFIGTGKAKFLRLYGYNVNPNGGNFSVATLPLFGLEADISYATDGRKVGEGPGMGTGVPVYFSNGQWLTFSGDTVVLA
jgi:hypothetical protein